YDHYLDEHLAFLRTWSQTNVRCLVNLSTSRIEEKVSLLAHISSIDTIQIRGSGSINDAYFLGHHILQSCNTRAVVITLGNVGAMLVDQHDAHFVPAEPVQAVRTIGA